MTYSNVCFVILFIMMIILIYMTYTKDENIKHKYFRYGKHLENSIEVIDGFKHFFRKDGIERSDNVKDATCIFFYKLEDLKKLNTCNFNDKKIIYGFKTIDTFCSKVGIYKLLKHHLDKDTLRNIIPTTYVINEKESFNELKTNFEKLITKNVIFILKNDIQRQEGLLITNEYKDIITASKKKYLVVQHLLQEPFLINNRKINIRVYMLLCLKNKTTSLYIYNDGFIYYTPKFYKQNSLDKDENITTGYIDRKVYDENPLTIKDFRKYLDENNHDKDLFDDNLKYLFKNVCSSIQLHVIENEGFDNCVSKNDQFNIFGCDVAINSKLQLKLMEINKGPDLNAKDGRDGKLKSKLIQDSWNIITSNYDILFKTDFTKIC